MLSMFAMCLFAVVMSAVAQDAAEKALTEACLAGNADAIQSSAMELLKTGAYGADKLEYASNVLSSVEVNGVLFTGSKGDTYPVIMLQYLKNMRTDVRVVHTDWMKDASYFQRLQSLIGIAGTEATHIQALSRNMPVYLSLAAGKELISSLESNLYCTGLAFKCSAAPLSNVKVMYNQWWKNCGKNYMSSGYSLNSNYLIPLAMLADYTKASGLTEANKIIRDTYAEVAKSVGEKERIPSMK
jgi:hypothetical protein